MGTATSAIRVVGVGNPDRGDDGIGPAVATALMERVSPNVDVVLSTADPSRLIERWGSADTVVLVDAVLDDQPPGTVEVFDASVDALPVDIGAVSSHGFGVAGSVELARSLNRMPARLMVVGVVGRDFDGVGLTSEVEKAIEAAVDAVMEVVGHA